MYYYCIDVANGKSFIRHPSYFRNNWGSIPLKELISFWLGHKKILKANFVKKLYYGYSVLPKTLLKEADEWMPAEKPEDNFDFMFKHYPEVIIPAMIEMKIFFKILNAILEKANNLNFKEKKNISETLNSTRVSNVFEIKKGFNLSDDAQKFVAIRNVFSFRVTNDFCSEKLEVAKKEFEDSAWQDLSNANVNLLEAYRKYSPVIIDSEHEGFTDSQFFHNFEKWGDEVLLKKVSAFLAEENKKDFGTEKVFTFVEKYLPTDKMVTFLNSLKDSEKSEKLFNINLCLCLFHHSEKKALDIKLQIAADYLLRKIESGKHDDCFDEYESVPIGSTFVEALAKRLYELEMIAEKS